MDNLLARFREVFTTIDDVLIVAKRTKQQLLDKVGEILKAFDEAELQLKAGKFIFAKQEI